jgi:glycine/D-amino acid oxidase-like deaminating enzyme
MRLGIVGAGLAGSLLAWRLAGLMPAASIDLHTGGAALGGDATGASGGLVRGFEMSPSASAAAVASLAEIRDSPVLRAWTGYQEIGSLYLSAPAPDLAERANAINRVLPDSAELLDAEHLTRAYQWRGLPETTVAVLERSAGWVSPAAFRDAILTELSGAGTRIRTAPVSSVRSDPLIVLADGTVLHYDAVVLAAGSWTPQLLLRSAMPLQGLRIRKIQYGIHPVRWPGLGAFVDHLSGLYGRPYGRDGFLLGLPSRGPDLDPAADPGSPPIDADLVAQVAAFAGRCLGGGPPLPPPVRVVCACDCYHDEPGLVLRGGPAVFTFTGGSGGAAKTVLAQSRAAATTLLSALH